MWHFKCHGAVCAHNAHTKDWSFQPADYCILKWEDGNVVLIQSPLKTHAQDFSGKNSLKSFCNLAAFSGRLISVKLTNQEFVALGFEWFIYNLYPPLTERLPTPLSPLAPVFSTRQKYIFMHRRGRNVSRWHVHCWSSRFIVKVWFTARHF